MHPAISPASANDSLPRAWASQIRSSTVPNAWWGRTLHQSWVASAIDRVRTNRSMKSAYVAQSPNG